MRHANWIFVGLFCITIAAAIAVWQARSMIVIGSGFKAKMLCSSVFVSKRAEEDVLGEDLHVDGFEVLRLFFSHVDHEAKRVSTSLLGFWKRVAIYREGLGCTLVLDTTEKALRAQPVPGDVSAEVKLSSSELWPQGSRVDPAAISSEVDQNKLRSAMNFVFSEPNPAALQRTRAVVIVHRGRIVAERYAKGFDATTAQLGWSMSKSALNALIAISTTKPEVIGQLVKPVDLAATGLLPQWQNDRRSGIRLNDLLHMSSGLAFSENYQDYNSDALRMLFAVGNKGGFAADQDAAAKSGKEWEYSSGTSNIIAYILRRQFKTTADYLALPRRHLFTPLGMRSAVFEPDASGTLTASSFMYASARDWARLGLLYFRDGDWFGKRILPEGWTATTLTPAKTSQDQQYGLHLWLKLPERPDYGEPPMPDDSFYMLGHDGQVIAVVPSRELVIVRMGLARKTGSWHPETVLGALTAPFPKTTTN